MDISSQQLLICLALLEHTTDNKQLFHNHGYIDTTIDRVGYKRKATDNLVAEARKQNNELGLTVGRNTLFRSPAGNDVRGSVIKQASEDVENTVRAVVRN
jgi:hypothetical protein